MEKKPLEQTKKIDKENIKIENGRVVIESEELANMIESGELNIADDEEAGGNFICIIMC